MTTLELLAGDKFFDNNPEKLLGDPYETTGQYGIVTKYKGTLTEAIDKMDKVPVDMLTVADIAPGLISVIETDSTMPSPEETVNLFRQIKPTNFQVDKTEAIDFNKRFFWLDNEIFESEKTTLIKNGKYDSWIEVNLIKDPNQLLHLIRNRLNL